MDVDRHLLQAADQLRAEVDQVAVPPPPVRRPRTVLIGVSAVVLLLVAFGVLFASRGSGLPPAGQAASSTSVTTVSTTVETTSTVVTTASTSPVSALGPLFGKPVPWVLLLDDGIDGVLAIDPNNRIASRSVIDGQRAGDQPYRLRLVDGRLITGWEHVYATDLGTRDSELIGDATIYVPAAEPDRVWLIDYPGGRLGMGTPEVWQVSGTGEKVTDSTRLELEGGFPAIGVPGGLAIETDDGVALWDAASGEVVELLGSGIGFVSDASPGPNARLAWCVEKCTKLHITAIGSGDDLVADIPKGAPFDARSARFSGDGRYLAVVAGSDVVVIDIENESLYTAFSVPGFSSALFVSWAPVGAELFASTYSYGASSTTIVYHSVLTQDTSVVELPFGGSLSFVVVGQNQAESFFIGDLLTPADCPPPEVFPSRRTGTCAFRF